MRAQKSLPLSRRGAEQSEAERLFSRKKVKSIKISATPSIDGDRSTVTSCKSDPHVSGGAYQDIRKVTIEWNDA